MNSNYRGKHIQRPRKTPRVAILGLLILCAITAVLELTNTTHFFHAKKAVSGPIKTINAPSQTASSNATSSTNQTPSDKSSSASQSSTGSSLAAPYGSFVSNHRPGQNGANMTELSQCITTPGATCYIKFTQDDVVKTLPEKTADASGSMFWEWSINDAGLTSGKWVITAIASLNGQSKSTTDQLNLEVQ